MNEPIENMLSRALALRRQGVGVIACVLVKARGSTPQAAGAVMLVDQNANTWGTIGGGCVEAEVRRQAHSLLSERRSGLVRFKLDHDYGWDDGLICGGTIELAIAPLPENDVLEDVIGAMQRREGTEIIFHVTTENGEQQYALDLPARPRLHIAGAGHIGQAVARLGMAIEFDVTLFDDRLETLAGRSPAGCGLVEGDIAEQLRRAPVDHRTFIVIVTRGHRHDEQALEASLGRGAAYVGMIGSRRKVKLIFDDLLARGAPQEELDLVHAPIGLDLGAVSVEEIAVSIVAQIIKIRRADQQPGVRLISRHEPAAR